MPWLYPTPATRAKVVAGAAAAALPALVAAIVISRPRSDEVAAYDARRLDEVFSWPVSLRLVVALTQNRGPGSNSSTRAWSWRSSQSPATRRGCSIRVGYAVKRPRTRLSAGRAASAQHLVALRDGVGGGQPYTTPRRGPR
ncbi:MAG: hypothetical protein ABI181_07540 [Mycobacteriaceae bacterium]